MEIRRFFISKEDFDGNFVVLTGQQYTHAVKVLRQKVGYLIIACVGDGLDILAKIIEIDSNKLIAEVIKIEQNLTEPNVNITLFQATAKESDFIVQKAVELGATKVVPMKTAYTNAECNIERLKKVALEASKQCGRAKLIKIEDEISFENAVKTFENYDIVIMPYENAKDGQIGNLSLSKYKNIALVVGSEGGFMQEEVELAMQNGANIVTLGKRILRAETAVIASLTLVLEYCNQLK